MNEHAKILFATQTINFLSARLQVIIQNMETIPGDQNLGKHHAEMNGIVQDLKKIAENLGNYMNNCDAIDDLDDKVTAAAIKYL